MGRNRLCDGIGKFQGEMDTPLCNSDQTKWEIYFFDKKQQGDIKSSKQIYRIEPAGKVTEFLSGSRPRTEKTV